MSDLTKLLPDMTADDMVAVAYDLISKAQQIYAAEHAKYDSVEHYNRFRAYAAATRADALTDAQISLGTHWELD